MPSESQPGLLPSVLDRLLDPESGGTSFRQGYSIEQMADSVRRDLEMLLNTRQPPAGLLADFPEAARSVTGYGLPDVVSYEAITPEQRENLGRLIEAAISEFEPRLQNVRAELIDPGDQKRRDVRYRISAKLCLDPAPEVAFDTILELTNGHHSVNRAEG